VSRKKGMTLSEFMVAFFVLALISGFLAQFYVLMARVYDEVAVQSELQRNLRKIAGWVFHEIREASPTGTTSLPILEPSSTTTTSSTLRFTRPVDINNPRATTYETVRYRYDGDTDKLYRQIDSGAEREICNNISSMTFTWINNYTVLVQFTIAQTLRGVDRRTRTVTASAEAYMTVRFNQ